MASTSTIAHIPSPPKGPHHYSPTSHKDGAHQWSESAHNILKLANAEVFASAHLRGQSEKTHKQLLRAVEEQQSVVNERLKKRIKDCTVLRTKLRTEEKVLENEIALLEAALQKTVKLQSKLNRPLTKAKERVDIRSHRPTEENITDIATKTIATHIDGVQDIQQQLHANAHQAGQLVQKMRKHLNVLQRDIAQKTQAIDVDLACLNFGEHIEDSVAGTGTGGTPRVEASGSQAPTLPTAAEGPYAVSKSVTNVESWKHLSGYNIETARGLSNESKDLRQKLLLDIKKSTETQHKLNLDCLEALSRRRNQTKQYVAMMESQLRKLENETRTLAEEHSKVQQALFHKLKPLEVVKKRLENRINRPGAEAVRDDVEVELEKEFQRLVAAVEALQAKQKNIETELLRLEKSRATVLADHDRKVAALTLEQQCLDVDAKTEYQMDSRQTTPRTHNGESLGETAPSKNEFSLPPISQSIRVGTPRSNGNGNASPRR